MMAIACFLVISIKVLIFKWYFGKFKKEGSSAVADDTFL